ncbi:gamma-tubulin complex component 6-like isoform X2 [Palaemon carinicauda]|uniref:gamma-tubulin complex component 6-like isoform X2 n=1 Tax=Palaemon carinicauda TaxID=392227 RepID=UPI0035B69C5F
MVVVPNKKKVNGGPGIAGSANNPSVFNNFNDVSPQDILKNLEVKKVVAPSVISPLVGKPNFESTTLLVNSLSDHFSTACLENGRHRGKSDDSHHRKLKNIVYANLLSYRKEYFVGDNCKSSSPVDQLSNIKANEVENLVWMTHVFVLQRRFDDANSLNKCLDVLKKDGYMETGSDVRQVLKFLVALKGCGGKQENIHLPAKIMPRVITPAVELPRFLPDGPLNYGDTYDYSAQHRFHFTNFTADVFKISSEEAQRYRDDVSLPISKDLLGLTTAPPGTGINPMIFPKDESESAGKVLGAMLQKRTGEISPDAVLSVPELPLNPDEYYGFNNIAKLSPVSPSGIAGSDEGYDTRPSSRQVPEEEEEDVWEKVLQGPPITQRRTWENVGHPPVSKEKPFLSEAGPNSAHNIWAIYQEIWSHIHSKSQVASLCVVERSQLCHDILYLLTGVPSVNFQWCHKCQQFIMRDGLCTPGTTPSYMRTALSPLIECATYIKRLEVMCSPPIYSRKFRRRGSVFNAFIDAVANFLQIHRGKVLLLTGEHNLLRLLQKLEGPIRRVRFVSSLCCISQEHESFMEQSVDESICSHELSSSIVRKEMTKSLEGSLTSSFIGRPYGGVSLGLNLLGDLNNLLSVTKDKEYLMLLVYLIKATCIPFFKYLEDWIYEGVCFDPELEFMVKVDSASLLHRDRRYWTHGYTLRDLSAMPSFLREVLEQAFICGKALNLLKICSPKHYLVSGAVKHPSLQLCITQDQLQKKQDECQAYKVNVEYLAAKKEVTAMQRDEQIREEKQQLLMAATKTHANAVKEIERRIEAARIQDRHRKQLELKELKEEMEKASERKKMQLQFELEEERRVDKEREEIEQKRKDCEDVLREKIEKYYEKLMKVAEQRETLARWKVDRLQLNEARKKFLMHYEWTKEEEDTVTENGNIMEENTADVKVEVECLFGKTRGDPLQTKDSIVNEGFLRIDRDRIEYVEPSPTEESTSGCDMSVSRMSTSSDFVDTPHDENIPELEIDPVKSQERSDTSMRGKVPSWGSSYGKKRQSFDPQLLQSPREEIYEEEASPSNEGLKTVSEYNRQKVLREEYGIDIGDTNANFASSQVRRKVSNGDDENGNLGNEVLSSDKLNSNLRQPPSVTEVRNEPLYHISTGLDSINEDVNNGNMYIPIGNNNFTQYQETRHEAALIKQKVLGQEFHSSTLQENFANINRSQRILSPEAVINKQKVLGTEYGLAELNTSKTESSTDSMSYSRQVSSTSNSSFRSCSSYDRQTSGSTVFSTPDEDKPILIDQVGGEVLKERGRSIHGHASDAVIHKLLWKHEPVLSPAGSNSDTNVDEGLVPVVSVSKVLPYDVQNLITSGKEQLLDISGSALYGKPSTAKNVKAVTESVSLPTISELSCLPVNFVRSVKAHLVAQTRLVNRSLLSEVLVQESLLDHFSALRAFLLLHDAHFARALILNLCTKIDLTEAPATVLTPVVMNSILSKSISESCWSTNPFADNLTFAVIDTPFKFTSQTNILNCLELRYRVKWPHTLILDDAVMDLYSRLWKFLASLHYSIWAAADIYCYTTSISHEDTAGTIVKCAQFHQICLYTHQMHHFLLVVQAYVTSQVHQTSWTKFEQKLRKKVSSLDELYVLHCDLVNAIVSRCFLNKNGAVVLKLIHEVFSLMLQFRSQLKSHVWLMNDTTKKMEHPAFAGLQKTYNEFNKHAVFLHKMLEEEETKLPERC